MSKYYREEDIRHIIIQNNINNKKTLVADLIGIPTIEEGEWIPCSERLPSEFSEDEMVLVTTDVDDDRVIAMFALDVKSFYLKGYVSAWMPLPEPWKGASR